MEPAGLGTAFAPGKRTPAPSPRAPADSAWQANSRYSQLQLLEPFLHIHFFDAPCRERAARRCITMLPF
jgi:hypothetical protein